MEEVNVYGVSPVDHVAGAHVVDVSPEMSRMVVAYVPPPPIIASSPSRQVG